MAKIDKRIERFGDRGEDIDKFYSFGSRPKLTIIGDILGRLQAGESLSGQVDFGATTKHTAHANYQAFNRLRPKMDAETLLHWVKQMMADNGISYARALSCDFVDLENHLAAAKPHYGVDCQKPLLYWDGEPFPLGDQSWHILKALWGHESISFTSLESKVWGDSVNDGTVRQAISRLNKDLTALGISELKLRISRRTISAVNGWPD